MLPDVIFMAATGAFLHFTLIQNDLISFWEPRCDLSCERRMTARGRARERQRERDMCLRELKAMREMLINAQCA